MVNEARAQFQMASPIAQFLPFASSPQYSYPGIATVGESRWNSIVNHQYQFADTLSLTHGRHSLKVGTDLIYASLGGSGLESGGGFLLGQFTVKSGVTKPVGQLTINDIQSYTQSLTNSRSTPSDHC